MTIESQIKTKALQLGFDAVGITTAEPIELSHLEHFRQWLAQGCAAKMNYLHRNIEKRFAPAKLLTGAQSIVCVALNYRPNATELPDNPPIRIANYALYQDYHTFIKDRLFQLAQYIQSAARSASAGIKPRRTDHAHADKPAARSASAGIKFKACVDSVPIAERAIAQRAGLGFLGKNHMLIHPALGSQILLGELITTLPLTPDRPTPQISCGDCGNCITACPTGALAADGAFDARKCISYLTIEEPDDISSPPVKGEYSEGGRGLNYIFGCDQCILACPHEKRAPARKNQDLTCHTEWLALTKQQIMQMTEEDFQTTFANSPLIRTGLKNLKRNINQLE